MNNSQLLQERIEAELTPLDTEEVYRHALNATYGEINLDPIIYAEGYANHVSKMLRFEFYYELNDRYYDYSDVREITERHETIPDLPSNYRRPLSLEDFLLTSP